MPNYISEDDIEKAAVKLLHDEYGYRNVNCYTADLENLNDKSNRSSKQDVIFSDILKSQLAQINPTIPENVIDQTIENLKSRRSSMSPILANKEVYTLIREGIPVQFEGKDGRTEHETVKVIDFDNLESNDFLAVTQLWIKGEWYPRRPDILIYINGIPLVFIELKNSNVKVQNAYDDNLTNYKHDIPLLFNYNAFCVLSNALETRVGSFTAGYEHFFSWLRPDDEAEKVDRSSISAEGTSLERLLHGLFPKDRLLDYIENFILYYKDSTKIVAQNHQFLGVNKAIESFKQRKEKKGKLGVFWHTQGSGKSFSMIFLARKVFHKFTGNYTFAIITDRDDLDGQIYRNFLDTNTVTKSEAARPKNSAQMRDFFGRNMRLVFTLIQKFRYDKGKEYPELSNRDDIIVIVDEAHRTQYASLAENMRKGLPYAQYFAFTGTPLLGSGDQLYQGRTYDWFGGYISQYNFVQSINDGATVPLFYQKRVPEVELDNEDLSEEFYEILTDGDLDEQSMEKLEREYATELQVIKREDRLDTIAQDIVSHFPSRGYLGKGMVISVDKYTAVKMYDKVQTYWKKEIKNLVGKKDKNPSEKRKLDYMRNVDMAVVISQENGEEEKFEKQGLNIKPHRKKMDEIDENGHDIEYRFKDPEDKLQLVFVCAMWLTGFDAPTVSTLYLDKPMKDHTLMQTIARANRVTSHKIYGISKTNGEIVDYYNVFRNMKKALSDFALGDEDEKESPVRDKSELFNLLDDALSQTKAFCLNLDINLEEVFSSDSPFSKIQKFQGWADKLLSRDNFWKEYKVHENLVTALYEACKPEILKGQFRPMIAVIQYLRGVVDSIINQIDIDDIKLRIDDLLDQSVVTTEDALQVYESRPEYQIVKKGKSLDLSKIDFEKLKTEFCQKEYKHIEIANLRDFIERKLEQMLNENSTRTDFVEKLQDIIDKYNSGGMTTENYFDDLVKYAEDLKAEDERHVREGLSEDELEMFDILKKEKMTEAEKIAVKNAAKDLLKKLLEGQPKVLIQDWYKDTQTQSIVKSAIEEVLDHDLPESYEKELFKEKSQKLYDLVYEYAVKGTKWVA